MAKTNKYKLSWALPKHEHDIGIIKAKSEKQAALKCLHKHYADVMNTHGKQQWYWKWIRVEKV